MGCLVLLALLVLHRAKLLASNQSILALGVAPMQVVSRWCRCIVQRLCATDCKRPCLVRAAAPHSARHGRRACIPKGSMQGRIQVVEQSRCRTHRQQTTTIAQMQSQPSIHSLSPGKGVFGKDAEIRTRRALHEAKPSECPKGDRDCKRAPFYKNRLLLIVVNLTTTSFFGIFPD